MNCRRQSRFIFLFVLVLFTALNSGCSTPLQEKEIEPVVETAFLMGTAAKISVYDEVEDQQMIQKAFDRVIEIENRMTINKETGESEIIRLNQNSGKDFSNLNPDTYYVLEKGKYYAELSEGKFDITIGPLVKLWSIEPGKVSIPADQAIKDNLSLINYNNLILDKDNLRAKLTAPGMIVDLGAIAKGYAADEAARILREAGVEHAIINLGGNILTINTKPDGSSWKLGLQDPYQPRGDYMGIVKLNNQALVSSGTYEKYFESDGKRYHHILNPQTGYPEENNLVSVSIITKASIDADALSTSIFLLGQEKGLQIIETLPDTEAILITTDKKVYISSGIDATNFEIIKDAYQLQR